MQSEAFQKITSKENAKIKFLEKLNSKKYRSESKQFLVENLTIIMDALESGNDFTDLFITEDFASKHGKEIDLISKNSYAQNYFLIDNKLNKYFSSLDTPCGIAAVYDIPARQIDRSSVIYLNSVSDPGNLGTIMRSALAFGFVNLVLDEGCVDAYNPKVVSAAKDAIFKLNILEDKTDEWLKNCALPLYASSSHSGEELAKFQPAKEFCLVLGSESHGVSAGIMESADKIIKIPISAKIESLNVATAAAIFFYELKRN